MKILFSGGGTLGHIYPMVSVVKELRRRGYKLYFIGTKKGLERKYIEDSSLFHKTYYFDSEGLKRKLSIKNLVVIYKHFRNIKKAKRIFKKEGIDIVVGMGGFISASTIIAAHKLKLKTLIHEQNACLGLANKVVKNKVNRVLLSYPITNLDNSVVVGNPRISEVYEKYKHENLNLGNYLLVVGGSRGAKKINELIISLKDKLAKENINCILITGSKYYEENKESLNKIKSKKMEIIPFSNDLPKLLINAKLVISRAGATTLSELMALKKVSILIPSPNVTSDHQTKNAMHLVKINGAVMLKEKELIGENLFSEVKRLYFDNKLRSRIINNLSFNVRFDAKDLFIEEIEKLIKSRK